MASRNGIPAKDKRTFCPMCMGQREVYKKVFGKDCVGCIELRLQDSQIEGKREREKFLEEIWLKAEKYRMESVGVKEIDEILIDNFGKWK